MVVMIREVERAMCVKGKKVFPEEQAAAKKLRKCIVFSRDLPAGHVLTEADLNTRSPRVGVSPVHWDEVVGASLKNPVKHEEPVQWGHPDHRRDRVRRSGFFLGPSTLLISRPRPRSSGGRGIFVWSEDEKSFIQAKEGATRGKIGRLELEDL